MISSTKRRIGTGGRELGAQQFGVARDHGQHIVEVARDAAGEPADGVHLLCVGGLFLQLPALADVAKDQDCAPHLAGIVAHRRRAVLHRHFGSAARNQQRRLLHADR